MVRRQDVACYVLVASRQHVASNASKNYSAGTGLGSRTKFTNWRIEMRHSNRSLPALALAIFVITLCSRVIAQIPGTTSAPAAPAAPAATPDPNAAQQVPAAPPQICGNTAYCYESNDFAAT